MADPTYDFAKWALQAAPYLAPPLAPIALAAQALGGAPTAPKKQTGVEETDIQIGSEKDYGPNIGTKVYTGPRYGYQTIDTTRTMSPSEASANAAEQAEFRRLQQVLASRFGGAKKPAEVPPSKTETRGTETPTTEQMPSQRPAGQATDPQIDYYNKILERVLDPELRGRLAAQDTKEAITRALVTSALSMRQSRENSRRQIEIENIQAWRDLERSRIEANARQAMALGSTIASSLIPNQGLAGVLTQAYQSAMSPFSNFALK